MSGQDGKASSRKITAYVAVCLYVVSSVWFLYRITDPFYLLLGAIAHPVSGLLCFGIVTAQNIVDIKKGG